jgi:hypothetical protein
MAASRSSAETERLRRRFARLAARIGKSGWILLGTLHERRIPRPRIRATAAKTYGPYYQWTFRQKGRTITVNLSASQVSLFRRAIQRQRALEKILSEMRSLSRSYLEATTRGVPKRKPRL